MKIFVTGATGFIGTHVVKKLENQGNEILLLSRNNNSEIKGDLSRIDEWKKDLKDFKPDACVHLAWEGIPDYGSEMSTKNFTHSLNLFKILIDVGCKKIISAGSCWEYKNPKGEIKEDAELDFSNYFSAAKNNLRAEGEKLTQETDVNLIWARLFYVYGSGQKEESLTPFLIKKLRGKTVPELKMPWDRCDFIYVQDIADALCVLLEKGESGSYNVGSGRSTAAIEIANIVAKHYNIEIQVPEESEGKDFWADISKMKDIGWAPQTKIEEGIANTINYFEEVWG